MADNFGRFLLFVFIVFMIYSGMFPVNWTGFTGFLNWASSFWNWTGFQTKTGWDWLQFLILPIMLAVGVFWLDQLQNAREQKTAKERERLERESREDNQHETALQTYIDRMSELLRDKGDPLRESKPEDEVRNIARVRTLAVLPRLDKGRKKSVLQFLHESGLIEKGNSIIDLSGADLTIWS